VDARWYVVLSSVLGAAGQIFLKTGARGSTSFSDFANPRIVVGLGCYALGTALWLLALARLPLSKVYPFTMLTFVLVYAAAIYVLGEKVSVALAVGVLLVFSGLVVILAA
jgi:drug/metabolite transporter (DMT)-like permease